MTPLSCKHGRLPGSTALSSTRERNTAGADVENRLESPVCLSGYKQQPWTGRLEKGGRDDALVLARVVNLRCEPELRRAFRDAHVVNGVVLVDRRTRWGNPFRIGRNLSREQAIARYRMDLWRRIRRGAIALDDLAALDGLRLACWCAPAACHGHVLVRAAAWAAGELEVSSPRTGTPANGQPRTNQPEGVLAV